MMLQERVDAREERVWERVVDAGVRGEEVACAVDDDDVDDGEADAFLRAGTKASMSSITIECTGRFAEACLRASKR